MSGEIAPEQVSGTVELATAFWAAAARIAGVTFGLAVADFAPLDGAADFDDAAGFDLTVPIADAGSFGAVADGYAGDPGFTFFGGSGWRGFAGVVWGAADAFAEAATAALAGAAVDTAAVMPLSEATINSRTPDRRRSPRLPDKILTIPRFDTYLTMI